MSATQKGSRSERRSHLSEPVARRVMGWSNMVGLSVIGAKLSGKLSEEVLVGGVMSWMRCGAGLLSA